MSEANFDQSLILPHIHRGMVVKLDVVDEERVGLI